MNNLSILPILKKIPLFADLSENEHKEIIERISLKYFPAKYVLISEGEGGGCLYIIKSGLVRIFKQENSQEKEIAILGKNDFFGEMSLIADSPRTASAEIIEECEIFQLDKNDFKNLLASNQNISNLITKKFLERIKENDQ